MMTSAPSTEAPAPANEAPVELLIFLVVLWTIFAGLGYYVASQKGRPEVEGLVLGFLFGPLGVLIVLLLPAPTARRSRPSAGRSRSAWVPDYRDDWDQEKEEAADPDEDRAYEFLMGITPEASKSKGIVDMEAIAKAVKKNGT